MAIKSRTSLNRKNVLLTEELPEDEEIEERTIGCALTDLNQHLEVEVLPNFDHGEESYEIPLPLPNSIEEIWGEFQESRGNDVKVGDLIAGPFIAGNHRPIYCWQQMRPPSSFPICSWQPNAFSGVLRYLVFRIEF